MQVMPLPALPVAPGAVPQEVSAKAVPQGQTQAAPLIIQRAVSSATRSDRGNQSRSNGDRGKGGGAPAGRGGSVNVKV